MIHRRSSRSWSLAALACGVALLLAAVDATAADHRRGGGRGTGPRHGGFHHGAFHHGFPHHRHFHSFVFFGTGLGFGYSPFYYPYYPAFFPPPTYVSPTECYQPPVPRAPGVADLYTCSGEYVGPISVP